MKNVIIQQRTDYQLVIRMVALVLNDAQTIFANQTDWQNRDGGYFCLADASNGGALLIALFGNPNPEKIPKYFQYCQEKARRLALHPEHLTSWESRNPEQNEWGGAIRANANYILSFSGQPELGDEGMMMTTAEMLGMTNLPRLQLMAARSNQVYWQELRQHHGL